MVVLKCIPCILEQNLSDLSIWKPVNILLIVQQIVMARLLDTLVLLY